MKCPACKDVDLVMSERQTVEIDYCPRCRGVWLDRGELDKIIQRSERDLEMDDRPPRTYDREHESKHSRRKPFWRELFD